MLIIVKGLLYTYMKFVEKKGKSGLAAILGRMGRYIIL
jgi:hypothetical protein